MSKWSVTLLFLGLSLLVVCDGSSLSRESSDPDEIDTTGHSILTINLIKKCKKNTGSYAAFWAVMDSVEKTSKCLSEFNIVKYSFKIDFYQMTNATRKAFFSKYCPEGRLFLSCFDDLQASLRPCLEERDLKILNVTQKVFPEALDHACKNDGEIIYKLKDQTRLDCFTQKFDQVFECARKGKTGVFYGWDIFELTQDQCSTLMALRECLKDTMDTCDLSDIVNIYDMIVNPILRLSPCANNTNEPKDETHSENSTDEVLNGE